MTTFSIGIDTPEITKQKTREAGRYPVLKVKVGLDTDEADHRGRSAASPRSRCAWTPTKAGRRKEEAVRKINWLEKQGVEFIEQPLPARPCSRRTSGCGASVHIPVIADEACQHASDIPKLKEAYDGVNIKLDKAAACWRRTA